MTTVHAGWNYDDRGGRRPMVFHQSVAWGVNAGVMPFLETLVMRRAWDDGVAADARAGACEAFLEAGVRLNPFCLAVIEAAFAAAPDRAAAERLLAAFDRATAGRADVPEAYRAQVRAIAAAPAGERPRRRRR